MADNTQEPKDPKNPKEEQVTLSQAILSPLDSIFQAQIHAARSFLNMLLQIGYPHLSIDPETGRPYEDKEINPEKNYRPYEMEFNFQQNDAEGNPQTFKAQVPALALVPLNSLAVSEAEFNFGLKVKSIERFQQIQSSEKKAVEKEKSTHRAPDDTDDMTNRKWNLVKDPKSLKGTISSKPSDRMKEDSEEAIIDITIKLSKTPIPAALDNLLTSLTKSVVIQKKEDHQE